MHTTLTAFDIVGFGNHDRDDEAQLHLRRVMYEQVSQAFLMGGLPWEASHREDRGDGILAVPPAGTDPVRFLDPFAHHLTARLRRTNRLAADTTRLRLRMAVHHGQVHHDVHGVAGHAALHLFRLLDAPAFKALLDSTGADLGIVVSGGLYDSVRHSGLIDPTAYSPLQITCKETDTRAWVWLPCEHR